MGNMSHLNQEKNNHINGWRNSTIENKHLDRHRINIPIKIKAFSQERREGEKLLHGKCRLISIKERDKEKVFRTDILINEKSEEKNDTLMHELIHASLHDIEINSYNDNIVKLAKKVDKNEVFINKLSRALSSKIKLLEEDSHLA